MESITPLEEVGSTLLRCIKLNTNWAGKTLLKLYGECDPVIARYISVANFFVFKFLALMVAPFCTSETATVSIESSTISFICSGVKKCLMCCSFTTPTTFNSPSFQRNTGPPELPGLIEQFIVVNRGPYRSPVSPETLPSTKRASFPVWWMG